jgi:hypothetical protein
MVKTPGVISTLLYREITPGVFGNADARSHLPSSFDDRAGSGHNDSSWEVQRATGGDRIPTRLYGLEILATGLSEWP